MGGCEGGGDHHARSLVVSENRIIVSCLRPPPVIARSEATKQPRDTGALWVASLALAMTVVAQVLR
jgi:hypothetical protein